ncbi:MAG: permease [Burkholderiales bacterium PBB3]|nr:MAG: permease [Burkholderiales bacterium PBB3]
MLHPFGDLYKFVELGSQSNLQQVLVASTAGNRFIAAALMLPFAVRAPKQAWRDGGVLGVIVLASYVAQAYGLEHISSNRSAFLTSLNVLMVPMLGFVLGARPSWLVWAAAALACVGIGLMSWEGGAHWWADAATILGALAYAIDVIILSKWAVRHNPKHLAATQVVWMAGLGGVWMVLASVGTDSLATLPDRMDWQVFAGLVYLGVIATAGMLFLQAIAQRHVTADKAALVYATEPVFAAVFAWLWLGEALALQASIGAALVVIAVVMSEYPTRKRA